MLTKAKLFLKFLFRFRAPTIEKLDYIDYVIINKGYFLISWKSSYAYKLRIKSLYSTYFVRSGSIYISIPDGIDSLEIEISNLWYSEKFNIKLKKIEIEPEFEFNLTSNFTEWRSAKINLSSPKLSSGTPLYKGIQPKLTKPNFSVQNLTFLKP